MPCCVLFCGAGRAVQPLRSRQEQCKWGGPKKGKLVAALSRCPDSDRLRSCLWPEVLEGTLVLRAFDTLR